MLIPYIDKIKGSLTDIYWVRPSILYIYLLVQSHWYWLGFDWDSLGFIDIFVWDLLGFWLIFAGICWYFLYDICWDLTDICWDLLRFFVWDLLGSLIFGWDSLVFAYGICWYWRYTECNKYMKKQFITVKATYKFEAWGVVRCCSSCWRIIHTVVTCGCNMQLQEILLK
jgi:hypothetical protein